MEDFEKIRGMLAARPNQEPDEGYCELFLVEFRERQRREAMSVPVGRLIRERTVLWVTNWVEQRRLWWVAGAAGVLGAALLVPWSRVGSWGKESGRGEEAAGPEPGGQGVGFGALEAVPELGTAGLTEPSMVEIGWGGEGDRWTPGFQVADGMYVSASPEARLQEAVQVRMMGRFGQARIVMKDPGSGLVVIDARGAKPALETGPRVGR